VRFRIVDKAPEYFAGSRGKGLQPRSLEVLDDLGVVGQILANGRFHLPFRGYDGPTVIGDHDMHAGRVPTPDIPYASPLIIPQWRVEEVLRNRLAEYGARVELATELAGFEQNGDGVTATLVHSGRTAQVFSRYLIGADGGHSFVRKELGVGFEGETWKTERMLIADVRVDGLDREHWHSWPKHEAGWLALCPLPSTNSFQFQAQIPADEPDDPTLERLQQIVNERTSRLDIRLHDATWLSLYRPNVRMVDRYRVDRVFLAGDAAHVHSPAGGQGMNTGIRTLTTLVGSSARYWRELATLCWIPMKRNGYPLPRRYSALRRNFIARSSPGIRASSAEDLRPCNSASITEAAHSLAKRIIPRRPYMPEIALPTRPAATPLEHRPDCLMPFGGRTSHSWPSACAAQPPLQE